MALFRLSISLPDQPGSLGALASAIPTDLLNILGSIGGVEVIEIKPIN